MADRDTLLSLLRGPDLVQAPGAYDALTAKLIASRGFPAVYMTGYGTSASYGLPDTGLLTMTEMVRNASRIVDAVDVPIIADADTGYGTEGNVARCVEEYERAGVAAIHLEDQAWPKRCGHMDGKRVVEPGEMVDRLKAALDARRDPNFLIIARVDAIAVEGFEAAIERGALYAETGADMLFIEAPETLEQVAEIPQRLPDTPHVINLAPKTPDLSATDIQKMGYSLAIYPGVCLVSAIDASMDSLEELKQTGLCPNTGSWRAHFDEINGMLGAD